MATERHASPTEGDNLFLDILHEAPIFSRRKSTTIVWTVIYCILLAGYAVLALATPWVFHHITNLVPSILCSCSALLLLLTGIFQQCLVYQVNKIRLQGCYSFSQKLKHIVRLPFAVTAYGTASMLLVMVWKLNTGFLSIATLLRYRLLCYILKRSPASASFVPTFGGYAMKVCGSLFENTFVVRRIIMIIQAVSAGSFMSVYIGYVHRYNSLDSQPDVLKSLYSPLQLSSSLEGLRYHDGNRLSDQQMALLQYQRENLQFLNEEILRLQESLSKYQRSNDGRTPQVDLAHLLATRDQELRTLNAETNQLHSELMLARSLIAERDTEIQRIHNTNNQYVEENERLRAILGEWSARAAKLERALEKECMSNMEFQKKIATLKNPPCVSTESPDQQGA